MRIPDHFQICFYKSITLLIATAILSFNIKKIPIKALNFSPGIINTKITTNIEKIWKKQILLLKSLLELLKSGILIAHIYYCRCQFVRNC